MMVPIQYDLQSMENIIKQLEREMPSRLYRDDPRRINVNDLNVPTRALLERMIIAKHGDKWNVSTEQVTYSVYGRDIDVTQIRVANKDTDTGFDIP